tara:strand:- start:537 stop:1586 length:1050 start_codon:yes stop_codon:yes gene_type:complete
MANEKKAYFKERTKKEVSDLDRTQVFNRKGLIHKVLSLNPEEALELRFPLTPQRFHKFADSSVDASRKYFKHGHYTPLQHPTTQRSAINSRRNPLSYRVQDLHFLMEMPEDKIQIQGYSFRPVQGRDRRKRLVPFVNLLKAAKLYSYTQGKTLGFKVEAYPDSKKVSSEGAEAIITVPSRTQKKPRYSVKESHVPITDNAWKRAIVWGLVSNSTGDRGEPINKEHNIRYRKESDREESRIFTFYPQDIAAHWATIAHFKDEDNKVPWDMDPFAKPSQLMADLFQKFSNNILVYDPYLKSKDKLRKPRESELSALIAQSMGVLGHDNTMFWDPTRDPKLRDYDWSIPGED